MQCGLHSFQEKVMPYFKRKGMPSNRQKVKLWFEHPRNAGDLPSSWLQLNVWGVSTAARNVAENLK